MGIQNIGLLFPEGFPYSEEEFVPEPILFVVGAPNSNGVFSISGPSDQVMVTSDTEFTLNSPQVTDNADGSYSATSA